MATISPWFPYSRKEHRGSISASLPNFQQPCDPGREKCAWLEPKQTRGNKGKGIPQRTKVETGPQATERFALPTSQVDSVMGVECQAPSAPGATADVPLWLACGCWVWLCFPRAVLNKTCVFLGCEFCLSFFDLSGSNRFPGSLFVCLFVCLFGILLVLCLLVVSFHCRCLLFFGFPLGFLVFVHLQFRC